MISPPSPYDNQEINFPSMLHSLFSQKLALEESQSTLPDVTYNLEEFQSPIFVSLIGLMLFFIFYHILDRFYNWIRYEPFEQDIELGDIANHGSLTNNSDWSHATTLQNNVWMLEILNGFVALLADRQGISPEDLEKGLPLIDYKSLGKTSDNECAICLEDFEDDELCRVFPLCKHVFHFNCIDNWLRNHITCPICRNCIVDL
ncbi:hypothetical protein PTKIN_Ptkin11bG0152000 [Pterospermum kingtungense]